MDQKFLTEIIENGEYSTETQVELKKCIGQVLEALLVIKNPGEMKRASGNELNFLGDIHGNLPGALKAMDHMWVLDRNGNWSNSGKTQVQTGNVIDRKEYSLATILYFTTLKKQVSQNKENGQKDTGNLINLLGNHEQYNVRYEDSCASDTPVYDLNAAKAIRVVLEKEALKGTYDLMYADNKKNIISTHGEFSKQLLRELVQEISSQNNIHLVSSDKVGRLSKNNLYKFLDDNGLSKENIANHLNEILHKEGINGPTVFSIYQQVEYTGPRGTLDRESLSKETFKTELGKGCKEIVKSIGLGWRKKSQ